MDKTIEQEVKIRKATKKDIPEIARIFQEEYSKPPYNENWAMKNVLNKIRRYFKECEIYVAEVENKVVGFLIIELYEWADHLEGFIDQIVVSEKFQGRGIGKRFLNLAEEYFKRHKAKEISLYANKKAKAAEFYRKIGFKEGGMVIFTKTL